MCGKGITEWKRINLTVKSKNGPALEFITLIHTREAALAFGHNNRFNIITFPLAFLTDYDH